MAFSVEPVLRDVCSALAACSSRNASTWCQEQEHISPAHGRRKRAAAAMSRHTSAATEWQPTPCPWGCWVSKALGIAA